MYHSCYSQKIKRTVTNKGNNSNTLILKKIRLITR